MISHELLSSIKKHEGSVTVLGKHRIYKDSVGVPTIGYGHNLEEGLSEAIATAILMEDVNVAVQEVNQYLAPETAVALYGARLDALYEMAFNMGMPRLRLFKNMWTAIDNHDWKAASYEMLDSKWAEQVGQRAITLSLRMETGEY